MLLNINVRSHTQIWKHLILQEMAFLALLLGGGGGGWMAMTWACIYRIEASLFQSSAFKCASSLMLHCNDFVVSLAHLKQSMMMLQH
jgi:hypothetical protein